MKKILAAIIAIATSAYCHNLVDADKITRIYNDGYYSAVDIINYTTAASAIQRYLLIMAAPGNFVIAGSNASSNMMMSDTGIRWTNTGYSFSRLIECGVYGDRYVIMVSNTVWTSTDGFTWVTNTFLGSNAYWKAMGYSSDKHQYIAVPRQTGCFAVTTNSMQQWNTNVVIAASTISNFNAVAYGKGIAGVGKWVALCETNIPVWSLNGTNWFTNGDIVLTNWVGVAGGTNIFVGIASSTNTFIWSDDGSNWYSNDHQTNVYDTWNWNPTDIKYIDGTFYVTYAGTNILSYFRESQLSNATNGYWSYLTLPSSQWWYRIAGNHNQIVELATNGVTVTFLSNQSNFYQSRANAGGKTNQYYLLRIDPNIYRPIFQAEVFDTNSAARSVIGYNIYSDVRLSSVLMSNRYVTASNSMVRSSWLPGLTSKYYGLWSFNDTNEFLPSSIGNLIHSTTLGEINSEYATPYLLSNNIYYLIELTNTSATVNSHKVIFHLFR